MRLQAYALLPILARLVSGGAAPAIAGMNILFQDGFAGSAGASVDTDTWNIALAINTNDEVETYTSSNQNLQISGGGTVQIVPRLTASGHWTSGRIESKGSWTPPPGGQQLIQASIRMGDNPNKQGIWPAFWTMGDAVRHGTQWPACGELDIMEQVNGVLTGYGTAHCEQASGGICNEPSGLGATTPIPDDSWHTWALKWDLTSNNWETEAITWMLDGNVYHTITGATIGDQAVWSSLAHSPFYIIMNVAVGGDFP